MKKIIILMLLAFVTGYAVSALQKDDQTKIPVPEKKGRVTGIGGIFFKCKDPKAIKEWYSKNLGLIVNDYGSMFEFREGADSSKIAYLQWSPFNEKTKYFEPSKKPFMINYRVVNMEELVADLKKNGVNVLDTIAEYEYGKFVHILDPDSNKIELWEPAGVSFENEYKGKTTK